MGQDWVEPDLGLDLDLGLEEGATLAGFAPEEAGVWRELRVAGQAFPVLTGAFWTARQRQAANLHEVSYRACYKPQLPRLFIERLTGHSPGFFSVYTLPPNQAASAEQQRVINRKRGQTPPYRCVRTLVLKKTLQLLKGLSGPERAHLEAAAGSAQFLTGDARCTPELASGSVALTVTSQTFTKTAHIWGVDNNEVGTNSNRIVLFRKP
jgi:hypothetical protein